MYIITFLFFIFKFGSPVDDGDLSTDPNEIDVAYYYIVNGEQLNSCNAMKQDVESGNCQSYESTYFLDCEAKFEIYCQENDEEFSNIQSTKDINIIIGSNSPSINLSKLLNFNMIAISSFSLNMEGTDLTTELTLKGCKVKAQLLIMYLKIKVEESSFLTSYLMLNNVQIVESNFFIHSEKLVYANLTIPDNYPDLSDVVLFETGITAEITFTNDKWSIVNTDYSDDPNDPNNNFYVTNETHNIPYKFGKILFLEVSSNLNNLTFKVDDCLNAKLKSVIVDLSSIIEPINIIQAGKWESPLIGPLTVGFVVESYYCTFDESLNQEWFNFTNETDIPSFPPNVDGDNSNNSPNSTDNEGDSNNSPNSSDNGDDSNNPPPDPPTTPESSTSSYYIVVGDTNEPCDYVKHQIEVCKENTDFDLDCNDYINVKACKCSNDKQSINTLISSIDEEINLLRIVTDGDISVDFSKLKNPTSVYLMGYLYIDEEESKHLLSNQNKIIKKKIVKESEDDYEDDEDFNIILPRVEIQGNIRYKVPSIITTFIDLDVKDSPLNIDNLNLVISTINQNSQDIQVYNLITDESSHDMIISNTKSKIKVKQYSTSDTFFSESDYTFRVSFEQDRWDLFYNFYEDEFIPLYKDSPSYVPYSFCDRLSFIQNASNFELYVKDATIKDVKPVNISIFDLTNQMPASKSVRLSTSGNWDGITDPLSVYFTSNKETTLNSDECNSKIKIERFYFGNINIDSPVTDDTKKNNTELGDVEISTNDTPESIKESIKNKFDSAKDESDDKSNDKVIKVITDNKGKPIPIEDLDLQPDQFIKFENDANLDYKGGSLNLALDKDFNSVNLNVKDADNVNLSIKNMEDCTINIDTETQDNQKKTITINSTSEVYGSLNFKATDNVENITIESINLHESGSVTSNVPIIVTNIAALPQTKGKLSKVTISTAFSISQSASLELDEDVSLSSAKLNLNLENSNPSDYEKPLLSGKLGNPPASINLIKPNDDSTLDNHEYLLFKGTFKDKCEDWKNKIDFGNSGFNDGVCHPFDPSTNKILEEHMSLNVLKNTDKNNGNGGGGNGDGGKKGLNSGQIAGIVIGCVLAVAIVVGVVIFILKKKKNNQQQSSDEAVGDQQNDL